MNLDSLPSLVIDIALLIASAALGLVVVEFVSRRIRRAIHSAEGLDVERQQHLDTLVRVIRWAVHILILGTVLLMLLSNFVDITPLLASVGVAGLAVSLGAQTLIKDLIGGFLVLAENQYTIGDFIEVGEVSGTVEQLTLRATHLRGRDGNLHIVPNGEVRVVSNVTKDWSGALVDVGVAYEEDLNQAIRVLEKAAEAFAQEPAFEADLLEPPEVLGPFGLGNWAITMRVRAKTRPGKHWAIGRELQKWILAACEQENITLPYPRQEVWVHGSNAATSQVPLK